MHEESLYLPRSFLEELKVGQWQALKGRRIVLGHELFISGLRLPNGEYLIVVTNDGPQTAVDDYKKRWEIETLFGCLKTWGFNFESTHMTKADRSAKLVAFLAIAFCWCHITGEW